MNAATLRQHLARLDDALDEPARLCIYGAAAVMLMGEEDRFSVDIDVAAPYSTVKTRALAEAGERVRLPVNPSEDFAGDHIELVGPTRLCLAPPSAGHEVVLWQGKRLTVFTVSPADLIASRLIRYDPTDQADIQFLMTQCRVTLGEIAGAIDRLPQPFRNDALVRENFENLCRDIERWKL